MEVANIEKNIQNLGKIEKTKEENQIKIIYKIDKTQKKIKLFGHNYVLRNKNFCKIIYNNKRYRLKEYFDTPENESF